MSQEKFHEKILFSANFKKLIVLRHRIRLSLSLLVVLCYGAFVGGIAFYDGFFAQSLYEGSTITVGIAFTVITILLFVLFELAYIIIGNRVLEPLQSQVVTEVNSDD